MRFFLGSIFYLVSEIFMSSTLLAQNQTLVRRSVIPETNEHSTIEFGVMLPPSYKNDSQSYPVIYYLHGLNGSYSGWQEQMIAEFFSRNSRDKNIPDCILIFPNGKEGFWFDHYDQDPLLEKEIIESLIPYIDQNYRVDTGARLLMGWSSGGVGAITLFSKHPELFKAAISLDGAIISWEEFVHFQGEKPEIVNNSNYYYEYCSPNERIVHNKNLIKVKQDTTLLLVASFFAQSHQNFLSILEDHDIPFKYKELNCNHDFGCVFSEISNELLSFLSRILN